MTKKLECNKCGHFFSTKGGNYNKHIASCDGTYTPFKKSKCCKYCNMKFDDDLPASQRANHTRWCDKNPKRETYNKNLEHARSFIDDNSRKAQKESLSLAHKNGKYKGSAKKSVETKRKNGNINHTEESKEKIRQKALASKHRRLKKGVVEYKGILLDSSWELALAKRLDELNIEWCRPEPLEWVDNDGMVHNYFPDFYLPKHDLYIDPKNPHAIEVQKDKIKILKETYSNILILDTLSKCKSFTIT